MNNENQDVTRVVTATTPEKSIPEETKLLSPVNDTEPNAEVVEGSTSATVPVGNIIPPSIQELGSVNKVASSTIYLTDGELIPWKGTWWKVCLREINGEKLLTLVKGKPTSAAEKRSIAAEKWNERHSERSGVKRQLKATRRFLHFVGASSGSRVLQPAQA